MSSSAPMDCVLCGNSAVLFGTPNGGRYKAIQCGDCGEYVVSDRAADRIRGFPDDIKDRLRTSIRSAPADDILLIIVQPVGAGAGLEEKRVSRRSLRL